MRGWLRHWGPAGTDPEPIGAAVSDVVDRVADAAISLDDAMAELNRALRRFTQLRWWGPFEDLLEGDGEFAVSLRIELREGDAEDDGVAPSPGPIEPSELPRFREMLGMWGI